MFGAGGDDEMVERNATAFRDHFFARGIDTRNFGEDDLRISLTAKNSPNRRNNVSRGQPGGRNLIEQRLEEMVVVAIDDSDVERRTRRCLAAESPPNPAPIITTR